MDLQQLKYFVKIVEHGSFTKAARDCSVSQPALSQQIRKLETHLGQPLLERKGRTVHLTAGGQLLLDRARSILRLVADTENQITDDGETGRLSLSAIPTVGPYYLPRLLRQIADQFDKARFLVGEDVTEDLLQRCYHGEVDVGILALPADIKRLDVEPLFEERLLVAVPRNHRLAGSPTLTADDIRHESFVLLGEGHCLSEAIQKFCEHREIQPISTARIQQLETVKQLVGLGHGISFVPEMAAHDNLDGRLVYCELEGNPAKRTIALCWNSARYQSQLLVNFIKAVRELGDPGIVHEVPRRPVPVPAPA